MAALQTDLARLQSIALTIDLYVQFFYLEQNLPNPNLLHVHTLTKKWPKKYSNNLIEIFFSLSRLPPFLSDYLI